MEQNENTDNEINKGEDVRRKNNFVYTAFLLGGVGYLLPNYSMTAAIDYYQDRFPGTTIIYDINAIRTAFSIVGYLINNALVETLNLTWRITLAYITFLVSLTALTVFDVALDVFSYEEAYALTLIVVAVTSVGLAVQQSSYIGYASMLPSRHIQALAVGESLCGVVSSGLRIVTKLMLEDLQANTTVFFLLTIAAIVTCSIFFFTARRTKFVTHYLYQCKHESNRSRLAESNGSTGSRHTKKLNVNESASPVYGATNTETHLSDSSKHFEENDQHKLHNYEASYQGSLPEAKLTSFPNYNGAGNCSADNLPIIRNDNESFVSSADSTVVSKLKAMLKYRWAVTKQIYKYMIVIALLYFVTLTLFPGIITEVISCRLGSWMPVILMAVYNIADLLARAIASFDKVQQTVYRCLLSMSLSRLVYIPLILLCCLPRRHPIMEGEAWSILITFLVASTCGVCMVTALSVAPTRVSVQDREMCGNMIMMASLVTMTAGVLCSYALDLIAGLHYNDNICNVTWSNVTLSVNVTTDTSIL